MNTVVITGASKGIGHATALRFHAAGYRVFNLSRSAAQTPGITDIAIDLSTNDFEATITAGVLPQIETGEKLILIHNAARLTSGSIQGYDARDLPRPCRHRNPHRLYLPRIYRY